MTPEPSTANRGRGANVNVQNLRPRCVVPMPTLALLCVLTTAVFSLAGCCCYTEGVDYALKRTEARLAYSEPCDCPVPDGVGIDYERGWRAGYLDVSEGRSGTPPVVPPHRYRTYKYQTGSGRQAAAAWYQGFTAGAAAAKCQGLDMANRVFAVESPCCVCPGQCQCATPGVLPTAEAMLRQQQYRNSGQIIIEHEIVPGQPVPPQFAPTPVQPAAPVMPAPEAVETPEIVSPSPATSAELRPHTNVEPTGPELQLSEAPSTPVIERAAPAEEPRSLVDRVVAPPSPVELPSNVDRLREAAEAPLAAAVAETQPVVSKGPTPEPAAKSAGPTPNPAKIAATPATDVESSPSIKVAEPEVPQAKKPVRVAVQPVPPVQIAAPVVPAREPSPAAIVKTEEPVVKQEIPTPKAAPLPSLVQPQAITALDSVSGRNSKRLAAAPLPRVTVKETPVAQPPVAAAPAVVATQPVEVHAPQKLQPSKDFPLADVQAPAETHPAEPEVAIPDELGFPLQVVPSDKPIASSRTQTAPKAWSVPPQPRPFASSAPQPASPTIETLELPQSVLGTPNLEPTPKAKQPVRPKPERSSLLPKRLAQVPRELSLPESVTKSYATGTVDRPQPAPLDISLELTQPESLLTGTRLRGANALAYPQDISYSLHDHGLEAVATPLELQQPSQLKPTEAAYEIQFPATVWPASYEIETPPAQ